MAGDDTSRSGRDFVRQPHRRAKGRVGEEAAEKWLVAQGYQVIERNVRNHGGEIDLLAQDDGTLCFVEIKARSHGLYGEAIAAVPPSKQRRLARAAALYLAANPWPGPCRFDVLGLDLGSDGGWSFSLVKDAFMLS